MQQRDEEQALLKKFQEEREKVESSVKEETENEWEDRLKGITNQLEKQYKKGKGKDFEEVIMVTYMHKLLSFFFNIDRVVGIKMKIHFIAYMTVINPTDVRKMITFKVWKPIFLTIHNMILSIFRK